MKKLLLILLCVPLLFSCVDGNTENLQIEVTLEMIADGYTGQGTYKYSGEWDGDKYVGEFKDGEMLGQGTWTYANGDKYVGEFINGYFHGQGTMTYADGTVEKGQWENDKFLGN